MNNTQESLARLEQRVVELEARIAILDLEARYARTWDSGDGEGWASLYTDEGTFDMAAVGQQGRQVVTGRKQLEAFCREIDSIYRGLHFMHLPVIQIMGDTATSRLHFQWTGSYNQGARYFGVRRAEGYYDVSYLRKDGVWLIERRLEKATAGSISDNYDVYIDATEQAS